MFAQMTQGLDIHAKALVLRAERQRILASNMANADTPGYVARDFNFKDALAQMTGQSSRSLPPLSMTPSGAASQSAGNTTHVNHMALGGLSQGQLGGNPTLAYAMQSQPSVDGNSVDMDRERASFVDNSVRYESTLRFINGQSKTILSAIQGQ
ncbi:flagellar basal body rod protein FlgB [Rhodoferax sp.]|uniref:flagellar basal body rod protein FlgB n=1 Tax=Rhodoferax sp. TaxID=50421 RepID=UPI0026085B3D|nr:flagellar basal body rod protein FlgB [Rhodoferax sp.]MDD5478616.1 flagellar basal body rod protein FlgB [Rhodoferax sp.]